MDRKEFIKLLQSDRSQALALLAVAVAESIATPLDEVVGIVKDIVRRGYTPLESETNDHLIMVADECRFIAPLIKVKRITIDRAEGPCELCGKPVTLTADTVVAAPLNGIWSMASRELRRIAQTAPKGGCYDKTDFEIEWADGKKYQGRADVKHISESDNDTDLADHVWRFVTFHIGRSIPAWMGEQKYREFMSRKEVQELIPEFEDYYYLYDLGKNTY